MMKTVSSGDGARKRERERGSYARGRGAKDQGGQKVFKVHISILSVQIIPITP